MSEYQGKHRDNTHGGRVYGNVADRIARSWQAHGLGEPYTGKHRRPVIVQGVRLALVRGGAS